LRFKQLSNIIRCLTSSQCLSALAGFFLIYLLVGCQESKPSEVLPVQTQDESAIVNGRVVEPKEKNKGSLLDYVVGLQTSQGAHCSGTLIHKRLILTAAHCVEKLEKPEDLKIHFGLEMFESKGSPVKAIRMHPQYSKSKDRAGEPDDNDIAVILLESEAPPGTLIAKYKDLNFDYRSDFTYTISGFGLTQGLEGMPSDSGILRTAEFQYTLANLNGVVFEINQKPYSKEEIEMAQKSNLQLQPRAGVCNGDSGAGALVQRPDGVHLVGVVRSLRWRNRTSDLSDDLPPINRCNYLGQILISSYKKQFITKASLELLALNSH
jgi:secreted trypsin-like serine protease